MSKFGIYDRVRWSEKYLRSLRIEPKPNRPTGFITKTNIRAGCMNYEVCFEGTDSVAYVLATDDMLELATNA